MGENYRMFDLSKSSWGIHQQFSGKFTLAVSTVFSGSECQAHRPTIPFCLRRAAQTVGETTVYSIFRNIAGALIGNWKVYSTFDYELAGAAVSCTSRKQF